MLTTQLIQEFCSRFGPLDTDAGVAAFLDSLVDYYGFKLYSVAVFPVSDTRSLGVHNLVNNWPATMTEAYQKLGLVGSSPVLPLLKSTMLPITIGNSDTSPDRLSVPGMDKALELLAEFGVTYSVIFPRYDFRGERAAVILAGNREGLSCRELLELNMICAFVFEHLCVLREREECRKPPLSQRELECLRWSAEGKTSSEISVIMSLSEHTINYYLLSAARKLDAVNRVQAVAHSIREGWI